MLICTCVLFCCSHISASVHKVITMPGQFLEAPTFQMTLSDFNDGSHFVRELRRRGTFKHGVVKFKLPEEVTSQLEGHFTELGDLESENSFFKSFSRVPLESFLQQSVKFMNKDEGVFESELVSVPSTTCGIATVGDFYDFVKRERDFGTYKGIVRPENGVFDRESAKNASNAFWRVCGSGVTQEKPFLYGADIAVPPSKRLGPYESLDLVTVSIFCTFVSFPLGGFVGCMLFPSSRVVFL